MKIGIFKADGEKRLGSIEDGTATDLSDEVDSYPELLRRLTEGDTVEAAGPEFDVDEIELLPPMQPENTVYAAALNYEAHADEADTVIPPRPLLFLKLHQTVVGHRQPIAYNTAVTNKMDYEAELAAVIGKSARNVSTDKASDHVAGYTILNDISARDVQKMEIDGTVFYDWFSSKAMRDTTPLGPFIETEVSDPYDLEIKSYLNGEVMQDGNTGLMIRTVDELVSYLSTRVTLQPGDVITTGTPEGVGAFQDIKLNDGDTIDIEIEEIGTLSNTVTKLE